MTRATPGDNLSVARNDDAAQALLDAYKHHGRHRGGRLCARLRIIWLRFAK
jgi:hypothetical protein